MLPEADGQLVQDAMGLADLLAQVGDMDSGVEKLLRDVFELGLDTGAVGFGFVEVCG